MIFTEITLEELKNHQEKNSHRYFFQQSHEYKSLSDSNNLKSVILGVKIDNEIVAYGIFIYFKYKKFFYKVTAQYGPIMDYNNEELSNFYFKNVKDYFAKDIRVLAVRVNPFINEKLFEDVKEIGENSISGNVHRKLKVLGFNNMNEDLFTNPTLASRCVFSKELTNINKSNLLKNVSQIARYTINKTIKEGVIVREIDIFNEDDAKIFDSINRDTEKRINFEIRDNNYFKSVKSILGDKFKLMLSYIDCDLFINNTNDTIDKLVAEKVDLANKLNEGKVNQKKTINKLKELEENITIWKNKIDKIEKLKEEEGNIINLSCASFVESGEDLIYFTSGAYQKFNRFEGPYAITYYMMNYALDKGFKYYNFFGTSSDLSENSTDYKVLQFKRNFNGNVEWFMDNYEIRNRIGKFWKV
ncbi:peptidoglycan bridge formation glycyltransferase FemA/FemB family protein [Gemelliphila palaticanis]|uniref:Peptidoglycan bridge formation glycyltransferase FemA/FemB family protein n=1 Tax=Gemelliphila palaticanis TaxID=81950 RepID=A0ABX2T279_9BACL|nr:peptidoglycan bridge formation glycyltransferase FemA/FemB family protein [Gemella palaticanis]MBF0715196.1 peptidoglycan bridge formation glycyltransferase FemA/FemB family protein [Gemella palaticanis]NYS47126.1 peptidoglycan bridge formation glycyltransferase FemA/FemB family protein [Gemella palaticanis]